jgi:hypothetical protein
LPSQATNASQNDRSLHRAVTALAMIAMAVLFTRWSADPET